MLYNPQWQAQTLTGWRKILWDAAEDLETNGWCQRRMHDGKAHCLVGAINHQMIVAVPTLPDIAKAVDKTIEAVGYLSLAAWNDQPGRTAAEVVGLLRKLATE